MKKQKMSLENMRNVLDNILSREEMREIQAGSGTTIQCGTCSYIGFDPTPPHAGAPVVVTAACYKTYSGPCYCGSATGGVYC